MIFTSLIVHRYLTHNPSPSPSCQPTLNPIFHNVCGQERNCSERTSPFFHDCSLLCFLQADRKRLINALPTSALGETNIRSACHLAFSLLKNDSAGGTVGGHIVLVTDGKETSPPYFNMGTVLGSTQQASPDGSARESPLWSGTKMSAIIIENEGNWPETASINATFFRNLACNSGGEYYSVVSNKQASLSESFIRLAQRWSSVYPINEKLQRDVIVRPGKPWWTSIRLDGIGETVYFVFHFKVPHINLLSINIKVISPAGKNIHSGDHRHEVCDVFQMTYITVYNNTEVRVEAGTPIEAILVIFGRRSLFFFVFVGKL